MGDGRRIDDTRKARPIEERLTLFEDSSGALVAIRDQLRDAGRAGTSVAERSRRPKIEHRSWPGHRKEDGAVAAPPPHGRPCRCGVPRIPQTARPARIRWQLERAAMYGTERLSDTGRAQTSNRATIASIADSASERANARRVSGCSGAPAIASEGYRGCSSAKGVASRLRSQRRKWLGNSPDERRPSPSGAQPAHTGHVRPMIEPTRAALCGIAIRTPARADPTELHCRRCRHTARRSRARVLRHDQPLRTMRPCATSARFMRSATAGTTGD